MQQSKACYKSSKPFELFKHLFGVLLIIYDGVIACK